MARRPLEPDADSLLDLDRQVCFALAVATREVVSLYRPVLEPLGLTHPQYLVMLALWQQQPLKASEIASRLSLEPGSLSPLLKRLEARGFITRRRDPRDERALAVALTPAGEAARASAERVPRHVMNALGMELDELEQLRDALNRVISAARSAVPSGA